MSRTLRILTLALLVTLMLPSVALAQAPVVRAVLFFSPSCGHCQYVITEVLPPLFETYGDQLQIIGVDVTTEEGSALYSAAIAAMQVPEDYRGVPMLFVGEEVFVGSVDIPDRFPGLIEAGLQQGGIDWPAIPGLAAVLPGQESGPQAAASPEAPPPVSGAVQGTESTSVVERIQRDLAGNLLSIVILIGMVLSLVAVVGRWLVRPPVRENAAASWLIPLLSLIGMGVAIYLTMIELSGDPAVCGPVGDCNAVQQSPYAFLFGLIPIGALGVIGYAALILAWAATRFLPARGEAVTQMALFALALTGTLFSVYLTFLEPFIIGATCIWCLTSAILQTLLLWLTVDPARAALARLQGSDRARRTARRAV